MILYKCDPNKNKTCAKTCCQSVCFLTRNKDYAVCGPDGSPIIDSDGDNDEQASEKEKIQTDACWYFS